MGRLIKIKNLKMKTMLKFSEIKELMDWEIQSMFKVQNEPNFVNIKEYLFEYVQN